MDIVHSHSCSNVLDGLNMFDGTDHMYRTLSQQHNRILVLDISLHAPLALQSTVVIVKLTSPFHVLSRWRARSTRSVGQQVVNPSNLKPYFFNVSARLFNYGAWEVMRFLLSNLKYLRKVLSAPCNFVTFCACIG
jgi:hypothetical protein